MKKKIDPLAGVKDLSGVKVQRKVLLILTEDADKVGDFMSRKKYDSVQIADTIRKTKKLLNTYHLCDVDIQLTKSIYTRLDKWEPLIEEIREHYSIPVTWKHEMPNVVNELKDEL